MVDAALRTYVLLIGAALLALVLGTLLGFAVALSRNRGAVSGGIAAGLGVAAAIPSFFIAYLLQIAVIMAGTASGGRILPVFGFGYDEHVVLPLLSVAIPAIAFTAALTASRAARARRPPSLAMVTKVKPRPIMRAA